MDRKQQEKQARRRWVRRVRDIKVTAFFGFLIVMGLIGLMWFARPSTSKVEKRDLAKFPTLTWSGFWDGTFFSDVDTWYSDTFPLREMLISMNTKFKNLYGIRSVQLVGDTGGQTADDIPTGDVTIPDANETPEPDNTTPDETGSPGTDPDATLPADGGGTITAPLETAGSIYIADHCGFGLYYFNQDSAVRYCSYVNNLAKNLNGSSNLYCLLAPISAGVMLDQSVLDSVGASDENEATKWIYSQLDKSVKPISVFDTLKAHNGEYIYFHTDHHWTALGAYYAYREYCKLKNMTPHELTDFETMTFDGFLGTFYAKSEKSPELGANPDTVTAYIPNGTNTAETYMKDNGGWTKFTWPIVNDVSDYAKSELYATFSVGDQPFNVAHNEKITDGSSVLVVKNSYGNAFIPFLVDHYEYIYWIDFRYYQDYCAYVGETNNTISTFAKANSIDDIILLTDISATGNEVLLDPMQKVFQ